MVVATRGGRRHRDGLGVPQEGVGQAADLGRHGGREEQRLPVAREQADDALDVGDEAHVEHAVGLVDDEHLDVGQQQAAALEQVDQPARRGDQHVDAAHQRVLLVAQALAADEQRVVELQVFAVLDEVLGHLQRELARGLEDQAARHAGAGAGAGEDVDHRQREARRLAGAGLRAAQHVAAHQHDGDRLRLDRRGMAVAHLVDGAHELVGKPELGEERGGRGFGRRGFDPTWARLRSPRAAAQLRWPRCPARAPVRCLPPGRPWSWSNLVSIRSGVLAGAVPPGPANGRATDNAARARKTDARRVTAYLQTGVESQGY